MKPKLLKSNLVFASVCFSFFLNAQISTTINTGLILSKTVEGSDIDNYDWGRGYSEGFSFGETWIKPGAQAGISLSLLDNKLFYFSLSANFEYIQNKFSFEIPYYTYYSFSQVFGTKSGDLQYKSIYSNYNILFNSNFFQTNKIRIYAYLGPSVNIHHTTKTLGTLVDTYSNRELITNSTYEISSTNTYYNEEIGYSPDGYYFGLVCGLGVQCNIFNIPIEIKSALVPGLTNMDRRPNIKTSCASISLGYKLNKP